MTATSLPSPSTSSASPSQAPWPYPSWLPPCCYDDGRARRSRFRPRPKREAAATPSYFERSRGRSAILIHLTGGRLETHFHELSKHQHWRSLADLLVVDLRGDDLVNLDDKYD